MRQRISHQKGLILRRLHLNGGALKPGIDSYFAQKFLPPVSHFVKPIEGLSQRIIAKKLGLDLSKYNHIMRAFGAKVDEDELVNYTHAS